MPVDITDLLGYTVITEMVERVAAGIPKVLPDAFYANPKNVPGDRYRRITVRGTRKVAKTSQYGAPAKQVERIGVGGEEVVMIHSHEQISITDELLKVLRPLEANDPAVLMFRDVLQLQTLNFSTRFENLRNATAHSALGNGHLWFDSDGNLLPTSSGAAVDVDYRIPAGNKGSVGGIIDGPWSTASTNLVNQLNNLKMYGRQLTGKRLTHAFYGKNVMGNMINNTSMQQYLARNPQYNTAILNDSTQIPNGLLDFQWHPVQDAFFESDSGTITEQFPADQITFTPDPGPDWWVLRQGGYPVPKRFGEAADLAALISGTGFEYQYGRFGYAWMVPGVIQGNMNMGDTFLYDITNPDAVFIVDTTP